MRFILPTIGSFTLMRPNMTATAGTCASALKPAISASTPIMTQYQYETKKLLIAIIAFVMPGSSEPLNMAKRSGSISVKSAMIMMNERHRSIVGYATAVTMFACSLFSFS
ncbi:hypothetical protein SDC9_136474 [bioreactor metagenome]|uniref:Uncharacterized protein n=1 Tax=bioreactor metagenome TaxID=1076179 RepID=A0A645DJD5_9ZZZZ